MKKINPVTANKNQAMNWLKNVKEEFSEKIDCEDEDCKDCIFFNNIGYCSAVKIIKMFDYVITEMEEK